jgi:predicted nucleotidyltransferase
MSELTLLAQETGVDERTLRRAINLGSVRAQRPTPHTLSLSLAERRYVRRAWPLIARLRGALRTERNLRLAVLFGSAARGTDRPSSDVDILVQLQDPRLERVLDLSAKLSAATGRRVDLVRLEDARGSTGVSRRDS